MRQAPSVIAVTVALAALSAALGPIAGCAPDEPVTVSREALGTVVSITAYGEDEAAVRAAIDDAFTGMAEVEAALDAYDPNSAVSQFNATPYDEQTLPPDAVEALDAIDAIGVSAEFSPALLGVVGLYDFEGTPSVPEDADLALAVSAAGGFVRVGNDRAVFSRTMGPDPRLEPGGTLAPGLDFGGAAKGLALDRAREALRASGTVTAALISAVSSTVTLGSKPDGTAWRIGVEDPRDSTVVVAVFQLDGEGAVSTSGDYQRYFEHDGVRYHHIVDPATGIPARGVRSVTVGGADLSGLESDILSTALFVKGPGAAAAYAEETGLGLYVVDGEGRALTVPAPDDSGLIVAEVASPTP